MFFFSGRHKRNKSSLLSGIVHAGLVLLSAGGLSLLVFWSPGRAETKDALLAGKDTYMKRCASCHGRGGKGLGQQTNLPDFTDRSYMSGKTDKELLEKISKGGAGTGMPAWEKVLSKEEQMRVLQFIRTLSRP